MSCSVQSEKARIISLKQAHTPLIQEGYNPGRVLEQKVLIALHWNNYGEPDIFERKNRQYKHLNEYRLKQSDKHQILILKLLYHIYITVLIIKSKAFLRGKQNQVVREVKVNQNRNVLEISSFRKISINLRLFTHHTMIAFLLFQSLRFSKKKLQRIPTGYFQRLE